MDKIHEALSKLDAQNDNHWTQDGLPRLDTIRILLGDPALTREALTAAAPEFNRTAALVAAQGAGAGAATPVQATPEAGAQGASGAGAGAEDGVPPTVPGELNLNPPVMAEPAQNQDELRQAIDAAKANLSDCSDRLNIAKQNLQDAQNEVANLEARLEDIIKGSSNVLTDYHARQRQLLEERAARQQLIKDSGINLSELAANLKSPIDAAMSRKTRRGGARPQRL